jgi:HlyD family secretion protein
MKMRMKRKAILSITAVIVLLAGGLFFHQRAAARDLPLYRFVEVERGDLELTVAATGTLTAVTTVSVGTQVSGQISELLVDFNDEVRKGQLLARIDPTLAQQAVTDALSSLERNRAELQLAEREHARNRSLLEAGLVAGSAFDTVESRLSVARANVRSAQVNLERARQNLAYTAIHAPIDGVVIERNVDSGQTVAASLSAPQLFLIANDLSRMQILAEVDESDIAQIRDGQEVRFSVQAVPRERFTGTVRQVRLQSKTQDNVVNYTVVIDVENKENKLRPGMTASVDFLVSAASDVLQVPNAALRFRPTEAMMAKLQPELAAGAEQRGGGDGAEAGRGPRSGAENAPGRRGGGQQPAAETGGNRGGTAQGGVASGARGNRGGSRMPADVARLFYLDEAGQLRVARVRTGITDGSMTEIRGEGIEPGMKIIAGTTQPAGAAANNNPFNSRGSAPAGPRRGGGF